MAGINCSSFPISLRPLSKDDGNSELLHDLIYRIHTERKGIRNVTEEQLEEEIRAEENGISHNDDADSEEDTKEEEEKGTSKFIAKKRLEMTKNLHAAIQESATLLDTLSLLNSKYTTSAHKTMSPALKQNIVPSVLSYDKWDMKPDLKKHQDEAIVAAGSTMEALTTSADALLKAATRLEEDVKRETQYWVQVLSLHKKGWPIYKPPGDKITTVVQFSATEAGPLFKGRGIAALRANKNGTIKLDQRLSMEPKALRLRLSRNGLTQATSCVSSRITLSGSDASLDLEQIVRRAQDSLFDEELYHELLMETRSLQQLGVTLREDVIHIPTSASLDRSTADEWLIDLVPVDHLLEQQISTDYNTQLVTTSLRLLLSHLYHLRAQRRSRKSPLADGLRPTDTASFIRPLMAAAQHYNAYLPLHTYLSGLSQTLRTAGYEVAFELDTLPGVQHILATLNSRKPSKKQNSALHALMEQVNQPIRTTMALSTISSGPSLWSIAAQSTRQSQAELISFDLYTNLSDPTFRSEYILRIPESLSKFVHGKESHSSNFIPKTRFVFDSLDELKSYTAEIVAMDVVRSIIESGHNDWRYSEILVPEIRRLTELEGKKAEIAVGIEIGEEQIEGYMKWVSDNKEVRRESWGAEERPDRLPDVLESWVIEHSIHSS